ncbi:serine/threonine-protein kinase [Myxococcota bacterium]|nr:serine/threonine-protein kinase [Myxococcota bacterium]
MPPRDDGDDPAAPDTWSLPEAPVLGGRYRRGERLGTGGGGDVFAGTDLRQGRAVALKRLHRPEDPRVQREIGALRHLDLPGVVRLLDVVEEEQQTWLVMERVYGQAFPGPLEPGGPASRWAQLRPVVLALLETLEAVHAAGMLHRDLKPGNVLVDAAGCPVLVDFGLARGEGLLSTVTVQGAIVGTPRYLAPELLAGQRADLRSDLYAVGVMVFEALAGEPPHPVDRLEALIAARRLEPAPSLARCCPELPRACTDLVDALLQREPDRRPPSAGAALAMLTGRHGPGLPWLGDAEGIATLVAAVVAGRQAEVVGPPGSGRTRLLREVEARLLGEGRACRWLAPGRAPFESLAEVVAVPDGGDVRGQVRRALAERVAGEVLIADDAERLDRWTRQVLAEVVGAVLWGRGAADGGSGLPRVTLGPLSAEALRPLFAGPEELLHLPSDGARLLRARTGGLAGRVEAEVRAWLRAGLARWEGERLRLARADLERLLAGEADAPRARIELDPDLDELLAVIGCGGHGLRADELQRALGRPAWQLDLELEALRDAGALTLDEARGVHPLARGHAAERWGAQRRAEVHSALAAAIEDDPVRRLRHLLLAGAAAQVPEAAARAAEALWARGRVGAGLARLHQSLEQVPARGGDDPRLPWLVRLAVHERTAAALERALAALPDGPLRALVRAAQGVRAGDAAACAALRTLRLPDRDLQALAADLCVRGARLGSPTDEARVVAELAPAFPGTWAEGWQGRLAYRQRRFLDAALHHERAAAAWPALARRLEDLLYAASARLEAGDLEGAARLAGQQALPLAEAERLVVAETRARLYLRLCRLRGGVARAPDLGWVEAVRALEDDWLLGIVAVNEAGLAARLDLAEPGIDLARQAHLAATRARDPATATYAEAIALSLGARLERPREQVLAAALGCGVPGIALDAAALLVEQPVARPLREEIERAAQELDHNSWHSRHGIFSVAEVRRRLGWSEEAPG